MKTTLLSTPAFMVFNGAALMTTLNLGCESTYTTQEGVASFHVGRAPALASPTSLPSSVREPWAEFRSAIAQYNSAIQYMVSPSGCAVAMIIESSHGNGQEVVLWPDWRRYDQTHSVGSYENAYFASDEYLVLESNRADVIINVADPHSGSIIHEVKELPRSLAIANGRWAGLVGSSEIAVGELSPFHQSSSYRFEREIGSRHCPSDQLIKWIQGGQCIAVNLEGEVVVLDGKATQLITRYPGRLTGEGFGPNGLFIRRDDAVHAVSIAADGSIGTSVIWRRGRYDPIDTSPSGQFVIASARIGPAYLTEIYRTPLAKRGDPIPPEPRPAGWLWVAW